jgi:hypothetical protein
MRQDERGVLERAILRVTEQAPNADAIVDGAMSAGLGGSDPTTVHVKQLRAELLGVKAELERELERDVLDCVACGKCVHFVAGSASGRGIRRTRSPRPTRHQSSPVAAWTEAPVSYNPS